MPTALTLHPDRALPSEPAARALARRIYSHTAALPIVSMHGHVEAQALADDAPFGDPAALLVTPDHYVTRMLYSQGVPTHQLGVGENPATAREIWRTFCNHWHLFRGTPSRYWLEHELVEVFGVSTAPSAESADALFDQISAVLADPGFRPRALLERFGIELLATTDPAASQLEHHAKLAADGFGERVIPTFRPDAVTHPARPGWASDVALLGRAAGIDTGDYTGYLAALRQRRNAFVEAGALATDHGHLATDTTPLSPQQASSIYRNALDGELSAEAAEAFTGHMLFVMAQMSAEDGLVMQLHPGVLRDHHPGAAAALGPDRGWDIPVRTEFTRSLRPLLEQFGMDPAFRLILFTVDETTYSRELAPLAGVYSAVRLGAPWWFLDSPHAMRRFREAATETAGFYNTSGFVDDTRAYASIPARHDLSRRIDAGYLASLVLEHRLSEEEATETALDLAYHLPKKAYARR
ncbi:glucuronate isomerase [Kineosporia rhizophila]|uniref:glucuronate isomerase n=1 Tax=Kineosporia TaxID=49184 RepID=UPI001E506E54|nr:MULTISPECIES: glucuronate isomerase [Kineosporia]MCE0539676.1 glucuronate isomerase [Kineosporia rhizophila]GLY16430.1 uronate isomerase [Kineosporia sp. NBRC 101677]